MSVAPLYLQLHSLRRETTVDAEGTIRQVPSLGFDGIELVSTFQWPADLWRALLEETGLTIVASHDTPLALA